MIDSQGQLERCRVLELDATGGAVPAPTQPTAGTPSEPHLVMSPRSPTDAETGGLMFFLEAVAAETTGPFDVVLWKQDRTTLRWAILVTITGLPADTWWTSCCVSPAPLYFQVTPASAAGASRILLHVEEEG